MPRLVHTNPRYRKHRASGQAVVVIDGRYVYLGPHGTKASRDAYDRVVAEWLANGRRLPNDGALTVADLILAYWKHVKGYYRTPDGRTSGEVQAQKAALRFLKRLYALVPVGDFGPLSLKAVRQSMVDAGLSRGYINKQVGRLKQCFKWGVENELIPPTVYHGLLAVSGLKKGRSEARETEPVRPVPEAHIEAAKQFLPPTVRAMIDLQLVTGMRPGELVIMRTCDIDRNGRLWVYRPRYHKTAHHGHERQIFLGPKAQEILKPFLSMDQERYLFSPRDAEACRHAQAKTHRRLNQKPNRRSTKRRIRDRYDTYSYRRAIARACDKANVIAREDAAESIAHQRAARAWHPHQLRHNAATRLRREHGLDAARTILGQKSLQVAELYAEQDMEKARTIMSEVG